MKFVLCLLVLLPLVYCASIEDKRFIIGDFTVDTMVAKLQGLLGSDSTEAMCEQECHNLAGGIVGAVVCPPACQEIQKLAQG